MYVKSIEYDERYVSGTEGALEGANQQGKGGEGRKGKLMGRSQGSCDAVTWFRRVELSFHSYMGN